MPMHWGFLWADNAEVNALTHPAVCPISLEPELKACAVQLIPIAPQAPTALPTSAQQLLKMVQPTSALNSTVVQSDASTDSKKVSYESSAVQISPVVLGGLKQH